MVCFSSQSSNPSHDPFFRLKHFYMQFKGSVLHAVAQKSNPLCVCHSHSPSCPNAVVMPGAFA